MNPFIIVEDIIINTSGLQTINKAYWQELISQDSIGEIEYGDIEYTIIVRYAGKITDFKFDTKEKRDTIYAEIERQIKEL